MCTEWSRVVSCWTGEVESQHLCSIAYISLCQMLRDSEGEAAMYELWLQAEVAARPFTETAAALSSPADTRGRYVVSRQQISSLHKINVDHYVLRMFISSRSGWVRNVWWISQRPHPVRKSTRPFRNKRLKLFQMIILPKYLNIL